MPRLLCIDTYYKAFLDGFYINPAAMYETELQRLLYQSFGTFDSYSRALTSLGWEVRDIIANSIDLQSRWAYEHGVNPATSILEAQIEDFRPDVIFLQDVSVQLPEVARKSKIVAQISCAMPPAKNLKGLDCVFTSFPHYVERFEKMGIRAVYLPLAFDPIVLDRVGLLPTERTNDVVFVGGVGRHWKRGHAVLEAVAQEIPTFSWYGYGVETLRPDSPLRAKYRGEAFGLDMYRIFLQSKIVLNRHGEVAENLANNLRLFEATGCGAMLVTEAARNLSGQNPSNLFSGRESDTHIILSSCDKEVASYFDAADAVRKIRNYLHQDDGRKCIAANGQARTLRDHTYAHRVQTVSEVLTGMLTAA